MFQSPVCTMIGLGPTAQADVARRTPLLVQAKCSQRNILPRASARGAAVILPGLGNNQTDYADLAEQLRELGLTVEVVPITRPDWLRNAAGLRYRSYWQGTLNPRPTVDWYLTRLDSTLHELKTRVGEDQPINLLAHSAGGWLGRLYLKEFGTAGIARFVSLGSPHLPPPEGVMDQTRGILTYCSDHFPGAFHSEIEYTTIIGRYIKGAPLSGPGNWRERVAGAGYQQVCGRPDVWGDAIVPEPSAHLEGAKHITLEGVYHSPVGASDEAAAIKVVEEINEVAGEGGSVASAATNVFAGSQQFGRWYGSRGVTEQWAGALFGEEVPINASTSENLGEAAAQPTGGTK